MTMDLICFMRHSKKSSKRKFITRKHVSKGGRKIADVYYTRS